MSKRSIPLSSARRAEVPKRAAAKRARRLEAGEVGVWSFRLVGKAVGSWWGFGAIDLVVRVIGVLARGLASAVPSA